VNENLVVVSNRGPLSFTTDDDGNLVTRRGAGGLVSALGPALADTGATWIAAAISDADRRAAEQDLVEAEGFRLHLLVVEEAAYRAYYDVIANSTLWYLYHGLFEAARRPRFDRHWRQAWTLYKDVNQRFAEAVAEHAPPEATVLVQDYHLSLLGPHLAKERPDLRTVHFNHTPFARADEIRMLPDDVAEELLSGLAAYDACGFHTARWVQAFTSSCEAVLGSAPRTFVAPATTDVDDVCSVADSRPCDEALRQLDDHIGDRKLIVRVDRIELSKNILRGFLAFDELLETRPEWRGNVVFGASVYPSRTTLPDYLAYQSEVRALVERINNKWATDDWTPILFDDVDDFPKSIAALRRYDALLVNPVRDGLNLVAKEGAIVNERDGVLVLSRESGVWDELGGDAVGVNPFDVSGTAEALHTALTMEPAERAERATALRTKAKARRPHDWLTDQVNGGRDAKETPG
jgi:trehalose 6-phosphate synthase